MDDNAEGSLPASGNDGESAAMPSRRLTRAHRERLRAVSDSLVPEPCRDLVDRRYPWYRRPYYPVPRAAVALFMVGVLIAAFGAGHTATLLFGLVVAVSTAVLGGGANALVWNNERRDKRIYDTYLELTVPAAELVHVAEEQPDLGVLIWRIQQAVDGVRWSDTREQDLLRGIVTLDVLTAAQYGLVCEIVDLASERALLAQADGRAALDDLLRPRREAAAVRLAAVNASVEQLEAVHAEVALLDEHLTDLRIAEQILGQDFPPIAELTATTSQPDGLQDAAAAIRAIREFVLAHRFGSTDLTD
jgi:hypothetical protein